MAAEASVVRLAPGGEEGPCRARNQALRDGPEEWVFLLDSDVQAEEGCLERLLATAREHPEACVVTPRVLRGAGDVVQFDAGSLHFLGELCLENRDTPLGRAAPPSLRPRAAAAAALLVRRKEALRAGGFDESLVFFREDAEFFLRLGGLGRTLVHEPSAQVRHERSADGSRTSQGPLHRRRTYFQTRNRWRLMLKLFEVRTLALTLPLQLFYEGLNLLDAARRGRLGECLTAYADLWRGRRELLAQRAGYQSSRSVPDRGLLGAPPLGWRAENTASPAGKMVKYSVDALCRFWAGWLL